MATIRIENAGLVLINKYQPSLFERLGLMQEHKFLNIAMQHASVHYLQYVATG